MKKIFASSLVVIGFTSMAAQIVLMRELLSVFYGNEVTIGLALFAWLFWVSLGSWTLGRLLIRKIPDGILIFSICLLIFAISLPLTCIFIRTISYFFNLTPGQVIGPSLICMLSLISLSLVCIIAGFLFVLATRLFASQMKNKGVTIGKAYILEAIGAALGGLITGFLLIQRFYPLQIIFLLSIINLFLALLVGFRYRLQTITNFLVLVLACFVFLFKIPVLREYSLNLKWYNRNIIYSTDTIYSNISITSYDEVKSFYINGLLSFSTYDKATAERIVHLPMSQHPQPKKVLLIGGGGSAVLDEILKYDLERVDYVELDPKIIELVLKYGDEEGVLRREKVNLITGIDARLFVERTNNIYDVIILNLPQPHTTLLNRFYTLEFFKRSEKILTENGIFAFSLTSNPNYISQEQRDLYLCLQSSLRKAFEDILITPGLDNYFLAAKKKGILTLDWQKLITRLETRKIDTIYFREYYLFSELSPERIEGFRKLLHTDKEVLPNLDFRPMGYFYDIVLYSTFFKYNLALFLKGITRTKVLVAFLVVCILLILLRFIKRLNTRNFGILACVTTTGFSEMLFQIMILFSFQVIYGYVYYKLSIIFAFFMLGLIAGSYLVTSLIKRKKVGMPGFIKTQILVCLYPLILPLVFLFFKDNKGPLTFFIGSNIIFPGLPFIAGFIGGFQFPLANDLYLREKEKLSHTLSLTYGLDLLGASIAAILVAAILIPIFGIIETCLLAAILNTAGLMLVVGRK